MLISEFFENQEIFITGATGFIGKALVEKILYSCTGIARIFVLMRSRKGVSVEERLDQLLDSAPFDRLRKEKPEAFAKIQAIEGDCGKVNLGIKPEDLEKIKNVSIIFHSAASVRFDDTLRDAILLNTRGTYELIKIAEKMPQLKVFVHISTTYCNPDNHVVEEKIYPPYADWRESIKIAENVDSDLLDAFHLKFNLNQPNNYTFTKSLGEQIISDYNQKLPVVIFRPSIVVSAVEEPEPGYIDNFNGPLGLLVACGLGIMRTNYADPDMLLDFVPVDVITRALIIVAYKKGTLKEKSDDVEVINGSSHNLSFLTMGEIIEMGKSIVKKNPFEKSLWVPGGSITRCWYWNLLRFIAFHILFALLIDLVFRLLGRKPFLFKIQRRIYHASMSLHYFMVTAWEFKNQNLLALDSLVPDQEHKEFSFLDYANLDQNVYLQQALRGAKKFLLKENSESSIGAKRRMRVFEILHKILQYLGVFFVLRLLFKLLSSKFNEFF